MLTRHAHEHTRHLIPGEHNRQAPMPSWMADFLQPGQILLKPLGVQKQQGRKSLRIRSSGAPTAGHQARSWRYAVHFCQLGQATSCMNPWVVRFQAGIGISNSPCTEASPCAGAPSGQAPCASVRRAAATRTSRSQAVAVAATMSSTTAKATQLSPSSWGSPLSLQAP